LCAQAEDALFEARSALAEQGERWRDPSDTVFQVKARPAARSCGGASAHARRSSAHGHRRAQLRALLPLSMAFGFVTAVALYLVYRLLS
jgi:hypothetical protein